MVGYSIKFLTKVNVRPTTCICDNNLSSYKPFTVKKILKRTGYTLLTLFVLLNVLAAIQAYHATRFYNNQTIFKLPPKHINEMSLSEKIGAGLFGVKMPKNLVVDSLHIQHSKIPIKTEDSLTIFCWYAAWINYNLKYYIPSKGTIIMFHGHGSSKSGVIAEAEAFYTLGYNVLMIDFRAHGESDGNVCTIGYEETKDVKAAYDYIAKTGEKNIVLWGISLGASAIIKTLHDYSDVKPSKIILEMPFGSLYGAVKGTLRNNHVPVQPIAAMLTFWGGIEHGFWAFNMNPQDYAKDVHCPVLLQRGANDIRVTEEETQAIYKNLAASDKTLVEYADCGHQSLYKKDSAKWVGVVGRFLSR